MGYRRTVELREVPGLSTPATAGVWRPVILLPGDWRTWGASDRRAVLAHELAHVLRRDYAAGLLARFAVSLQFYHPLVRWMAGRLQLEQELAADALGARFAGGRGSYLVALSRLTLRQDGRSPCWPARAFLPGRGMLIRRIAMLREESSAVERPWSRSRRRVAALTLLVVGVAAATLRGPARGDDKPLPTESGKFALGRLDINSTRVEQKGASGAGLEPIELVHVPERLYDHAPTVGFVAFRPSAAFGRPGMARYARMLRDDCVSNAAKELKVDPTKPGSLTLGLEDIAWVTCGITFGKHKPKDGSAMHTFGMSGLTVRTIKPFDWLAFLRQWRFEFNEAREGTRVYYRVPGTMGNIIGRDAAVYLPDDRTIVFDTEAAIRGHLRHEKPVVPAYLSGSDWEHASRGLLALAFTNQDGAFVKQYDLGPGRPDDAVVLSLAKGVDHLVLGVDDRDDLSIRASAVCQGNAPRDALAAAVEALVSQGRKLLDGNLHPPKPDAPKEEQLAVRMITRLAANVGVSKEDGRAIIHTGDFGTLSDFASILEANANVQKEARKKHLETKQAKRNNAADGAKGTTRR
jgi:hypothetical protein